MVMCQFSPQEGKQVLGDVYDFPKEVYPVGRLDQDSEGLLLLTDDKSINHALLNPRFGHDRTYWVQVEGEATDEKLQRLSDGVTITVEKKPYDTLPAVAEALDDDVDLPERHPPIRFRKSVPTSWVALTLTEGKNRQVRKMTASVGLPTLRLVRYAIGSFTAKGMASGAVREITKEELLAAIPGLDKALKQKPKPSRQKSLPKKTGFKRAPRRR